MSVVGRSICVMVQMRVLHLAKELDSTPQWIIQRLGLLGYYYKSAAEAVSDEHVAELRKSVAEKPLPPAPPNTPRYSNSRPRPSARKRSKPEDWRKLWLSHLFQPEDAERWVQAGLMPSQAGKAAIMARNGIEPFMLSIDLHRRPTQELIDENPRHTVLWLAERLERSEREWQEELRSRPVGDVVSRIVADSLLTPPEVRERRSR